ncbi:MAG: histone deacetylase [Candidatus Binatia bacterium]|nr:histone deacetylase [Candidatus Binatia bacterium]
MLPTAIVIDQSYARHQAGRHHPERPERITALVAWAEEVQDTVETLPARYATIEEICRAHDSTYVQRVAATAQQPLVHFDPDTAACAETYDTARLAAGGLLTLLEAIVQGGVENGFALVRPPGHHAEFDRAMGFCFFNNVVIGAEHLRQRFGVERVLIVDWDVHHGNGTQHFYERDPNVLYFSLHQWPLYPGTGNVTEVGHGPGEGFTVNLPLPAHTGDAEIYHLAQRILRPIALAFRPDFVLVSAGFDGHRRDPLADLALTDVGYRYLARTLIDVAYASAGGRIALVLEGGYDLTALVQCTHAVTRELAGDRPELPEPPLTDPAQALLRRFQSAFERYWPV